VTQAFQLTRGAALRLAAATAGSYAEATVGLFTYF